MTDTITIRNIQVKDNPRVAEIIRTVMPQYGACGKGFAIHDPEVDHMYETYNQPNAAFFVLEQRGVLIGCAGIAQLKGGDADTCELQKMYFLSEARGRGWGAQMLARCLDVARERGYRKCYLETFNTMREAQVLYGKFGFKRIDRPLGNTGHHACDMWYELDLSAER